MGNWYDDIQAGQDEDEEEDKDIVLPFGSTTLEAPLPPLTVRFFRAEALPPAEDFSRHAICLHLSASKRGCTSAVFFRFIRKHFRIGFKHSSLMVAPPLSKGLGSIGIDPSSQHRQSRRR